MFNNPEDEKDVWYCQECEAEMDSDKTVCSRACYKAGLI